jgi:hypothetical protein
MIEKNAQVNNLLSGAIISGGIREPLKEFPRRSEDQKIKKGVRYGP